MSETGFAFDTATKVTAAGSRPTLAAADATLDTTSS
jgi:hypothetical protein